MPRALRYEEPGATYHVTIEAVDGGTIVRDSFDRVALRRVIGNAICRQGWSCLSLCIMDTHYHLLVTTPEPNLAEGMHRVNGVYAQLFNRRHRRRGHVFSSRYYAGRIERESHLLLAFRYIALNPVEAGIVDNPCDARWSSYGGIVEASLCWPFIARGRVLELFGGGAAGLAALRGFVEGGEGARPLNKAPAQDAAPGRSLETPT